MCLSDSLYEPIPVYPLVYIVCLLSWNMVGCVLTDYPGQAVSISQYRLFIIKTHLRPQTWLVLGARLPSIIYQPAEISPWQTTGITLYRTGRLNQHSGQGIDCTRAEGFHQITNHQHRKLRKLPEYIRRGGDTSLSTTPGTGWISPDTM